ncbi:MAG TPA: site-2 protease family protein, partial [Byssovorax sp.]
MTLRFSLFGFDVEVQPFFWIMAFLLGMQRGFLEAGAQYLIAIWIVVVFASVLLHELGHAFAFRRLHMQARIVLHSWGGYTVPNELLPPSRRERAFVNLAGPFAGFVPAVLIWAFGRLAPSAYLALPMPVAFALECAFEVGLFWGVFNLMPLLPLDGGHVVQNACGPRRARLAAVICSIAPVAIGAWAALRHNWFLAFYMGYFLFQAGKAFTEGKRAEAKAGAATAVVELPLEAAALIASARHALGEGEPARAVKLARRVIEGDGGSFATTKQAAREAYEIAAWAAMLEDRTD